MEEKIVDDFKLTGINTINVDFVIKNWNRLWWISEWRNDTSEWKLIKVAKSIK